MAAFNKFNVFVEDVIKKVHNLQTDQLMVALTNVAPDAMDAVLTDLTEINYANLSSRVVSTTSCVQTAGLLKLVVADLVLNATGVVQTFQYVVLYNNTAAGKNLIGWYDRGGTITLVNGDSVTIDFSQAAGVLTLQ